MQKRQNDKLGIKNVIEDADDDNNEEQEEEFRGLLGGKERRRGTTPAAAVMVSNSRLVVVYKYTVRLVTLILIGWILLALSTILRLRYHRKHKRLRRHFNASIAHTSPWQDDPNRNVTVPYQCPTSIDRSKNDKDFIFDFYYRDTNRHTRDSNLTVDELLTMRYGSWGITPLERKKLNSEWIHWYAEALQNSVGSNKTIYESACGVGLTLYVILELLYERYGLEGLEVYGNDYILDDVFTVNHFYSSQQPKNFSIQHGRFCHGDSTNLSFVPSNSFDVVMTGYIDAIVDPLELGLTFEQHSEYCDSTDPRLQELMQKEQGLVEDWFASWVGEMIRIAKPNSTIVLESIALPQCVTGEWGGVGRTWWHTAVERYGWDVNADTIEFSEFDAENRHEGLLNRYNVKFAKRQK